MSTAQSLALPIIRNIVIPAGYFYFDEGPGAGELYICETPTFVLAGNTDDIEVLSEDGPVAEIVANDVKTVKRSGKFSTKSITDDAYAMFIMGDKSTQTTSVASVTGKAINGGAALAGGRWYQLGVDSTHPTGIRGIGTVAIKTGATTHVLDTDYKLEPETARIYVIPGGGCVGAICTSDYATTAVSWSEIAANNTGPKRGAARFLSDNTRGENRDVFIPDCTISPDGEAALKGRDNAQSLNFSIKVNLPADGRKGVYVNGRPA